MSKIHLLDTTSEPASCERLTNQWVPHTKTLCGIEFHLHSDFLAQKAYNKDFEKVYCKRCLKVYNKMKEVNNETRT